MKTLRNKITELLESDVLEILCGVRGYADTMHDKINQHQRNFEEWLNYEEIYNKTRHTISSCENTKWFGITYYMDSSYTSKCKRFVFPSNMLDYEVKDNRHAINLLFKYIKEIK